SVHNTRIERPWVDVAEGFLKKWAEFFEELERYHGLDRDNDEHIGLLHLLFLDDLNSDAQSWANNWNAHKIAMKGRRRASPNELFLESQLVDGHRGFEHLLPNDPLVLNPEEIVPDFGISDAMLSDLRDRCRRGRWQVNVPGLPPSMQYVEVDPPHLTLDAATLSQLQARLRQRIDITSKTMGERKLRWITALDFMT
ncbi:hypothetical protein EV421DRAFT_1717314, partial [Armillaria borealis]